MRIEEQLRGTPRRWYLPPFLLGLALIFFAYLILRYPIVLRIIVSLPFLMSGLALMLFGLDLWRGVPQWRRKVRVYSSRIWPGEEEDPFRE